MWQQLGMAAIQAYGASQSKGGSMPAYNGGDTNTKQSGGSGFLNASTSSGADVGPITWGGKVINYGNGNNLSQETAGPSGSRPAGPASGASASDGGINYTMIGVAFIGLIAVIVIAKRSR